MEWVTPTSSFSASLSWMPVRVTVWGVLKLDGVKTRRLGLGETAPRPFTCRVTLDRGRACSLTVYSADSPSPMVSSDSEIAMPGALVSMTVPPMGADHGPGRVEVRLDFEPNSIRLSVSDDGVGLPGDYAERGRGFSGMRADAEGMGGELIVQSGEGEGGTTITCVVPHDAHERGC